MKANTLTTFVRFAAILTLAGLFTTAALAVDTNAFLRLAKTNGSAMSLNISNAGNQVWVIASSSNLTSWTEVESLKIFNGSYHRSYTNPAGGNVFYRAYYDATRQTIASTTTNALGLPATNYNYASPSLPANFLVNPILAEDNMTANNTNTDLGALLGRVLFYDKRLSTNQTIACASCHQQAHGFSDPRQFSAGFDGSVGTRNSMGLSNARWYQRKKFFWDERAATLEDQTLMPIQNPIEMGMTLAALTNRLASEPFYTNLFARAFGSTDVTTNRISRALAQFVRSIVTTQSKYDIGLTNGFANFTTEENTGRQIFLGQTANHAPCALCHLTDNFVQTGGIDNNGLEFPFVDKGIGGITGVVTDEGKFKVPSLRNIELTAPYMHDGRFTNLEQVVEFYNSGVVFNANLTPPLRAQGGNSALRLNLTASQKTALVAFLKTLTDTNLAVDVKLSDPFNYGN